MARTLCSIDDCDRPVKGGGWCEKHYDRWRKHGDPLCLKGAHGLPPIARIIGGRRGRSGEYVVDDASAVLERLWRSTVLNLATGCWEWQDSCTPDGYGNVRLSRKLFFVHRLGWVATGHEAPEGVQLDHLCRNESCWNPAHLELVTNQENTKRGLRGQFRCDHNPQGHDIIITTKGRRRCRICLNAWARARWARRAA